MAQDFKEMGKLAGEVLLQTMQQDLQIIEDIQVPVTLIERETISTVSKWAKKEGTISQFTDSSFFLFLSAKRFGIYLFFKQRF